LRSTGEYTVGAMAIIDLFVNVCDSMGANLINTIVEHVAPLVATVTGGRVGFKILSNLCSERRAFAEFSIPVASMAWKSMPGE
jgi:hydroxymethylglutaryl-CoA reductase